MATFGEKINLLRRLIDKGSKDVSIRSLAGSLGGITNTFNFVKSRVAFEEEPVGEDNFQYPTFTLKAGRGDCEDHCGLLGSLLKAQGYDVRLKVIPRGERYHVYPLVKSPYGWIPLDTTINKPMGSEVSGIWQKIYPV